ncbi:hypothetical protein BLS_007044 [Venturia inaequalis]|uniref:Uncharacterized protein n=1 Tax=Venturia inaequalis TaxID=5025 RepID=A0A8H3UAJ6_VENIN|nr:hypothetical protein BLS_007044 [Venturia inaequalis]KAE9987870.1 hypothetical protein EG328_001296 [Venturia inaequalis]
MNSPVPVPDRIRLHITPFTPALLHSYIPPSLLPEATNISYHALQAFPEKNYGYVELPKMAAQKIKAKLNGSTLKGSKIKIEEARPEKRKVKEVDEDEVTEEEAPKKKKSKKARKEEGEIEGVVLPEGRKVKRGWTETVAEKTKERRDKKDRKEKGEKGEKKEKKDKKKKEVSKYTTEPECLFRTELPGNVTLAADDGKKVKKHKSKKEVVVHEFSNTTKHASFLKSGTVDKSSKVAVEFIEGKGWVDEDGNLVEEESEFQRAKRLRLEAMETKKAAAKTEAKFQAETKPKKSKKAPSPEPEISSDDISSSDPSSESESESDSDDAGSAKSSASSTISQAADLEIKTPAKAIHPLEALFKRAPPKTNSETSPSTKPAPITTAFNFFAEDEQEPEEAETSQIPKTPGTRQDLEWRSIRSPAPTPDTAAVNRRFTFSAALGRTDEEDEEEDEDMAMDDLPPVRVKADGLGSKEDGEGEDETEFSKWFWENRGDNNRAWKKRRREAMKVRRKRENRRLTRRVV